ncbi:MAG: hypothetical protein KF819_01885 [Labilithrix sp.]|nr:hypothetical protein [Labilithrix sp.]
MNTSRILATLALGCAAALAACGGDGPLPFRRRAPDPAGAPVETPLLSAEISAEAPAGERLEPRLFVGEIEEIDEIDERGARPPSDCRAEPSAAACHVCCLDANPAAAALERAAFRTCACGAPSGGCRASCGADYCAGAGEPSAACLTCIDGMRATCEAVITSICASNAACAALDACVAESACNAKP